MDSSAGRAGTGDQLFGLFAEPFSALVRELLLKSSNILMSRWRRYSRSSGGIRLRYSFTPVFLPNFPDGAFMNNAILAWPARVADGVLSSSSAHFWAFCFSLLLALVRSCSSGYCIASLMLSLTTFIASAMAKSLKSMDCPAGAVGIAR